MVSATGKRLNKRRTDVFFVVLVITFIVLVFIVLVFASAIDVGAFGGAPGA